MSKLIKLSRSSIDLYLDCPCCFYRKIVHKVKRPNLARYTLNLEIDKLLKQEFDHYRLSESQHPIQTQYKLPHYPVQNTNLDKWRHNFTGIQFQYENFLLFGSIDDLWFNPQKGEYSVVDYKATSSQYDPSQKRLKSYNTQLSFYSWLLSRNNLKMSDTNYILLYNAYTDDKQKSLGNVLELSPTLIYIPNYTSWIENTLNDIQQVLSALAEPKPNDECHYCNYLKEVENLNQAVTLPF
jgi:CRISPR/Cas system-associated exonuclease Cas4 (RecB family)